jgi:comEA protein
MRAQRAAMRARPCVCLDVGRSLAPGIQQGGPTSHFAGLAFGAIHRSFLEDSMRQLTFALGILLAAVVAGAPGALAQSPTRGSASKAAATASAPVNLNTATAAQLEGLPGIGAGTAKRILDYRQKNGSFKKIEELMNVKGIGEKSFLKLKPLVTVGEKAERAGGDR